MQRLMKRSTRGKKQWYKNGDGGETFAYIWYTCIHFFNGEALP